MQGEAILQTIAEVSVAFAGFTGVVVAFGRRPHEQGSPMDAMMFRAMLATSLLALLFSLLPFLLAASGVGEPALWRIGSGVLAVWLVFGASLDIAAARRVDPAEWTRFDRGARATIPFVAAAAVIVQILNVFGSSVRPFAAYLGGVLYLLAFSSVMFVRLVTAHSDSAG